MISPWPTPATFLFVATCHSRLPTARSVVGAIGLELGPPVAGRRSHCVFPCRKPANRIDPTSRFPQLGRFRHALDRPFGTIPTRELASAQPAGRFRRVWRRGWTEGGILARAISRWSARTLDVVGEGCVDRFHNFARSFLIELVEKLGENPSQSIGPPVPTILPPSKPHVNCTDVS